MVVAASETVSDFVRGFDGEVRCIEAIVGLIGTVIRNTDTVDAPKKQNKYYINIIC